MKIGGVEFLTATVLIRNKISGCAVIEMINAWPDVFFNHPFVIITTPLVSKDHAESFVTEMVV